MPVTRQALPWCSTSAKEGPDADKEGDIANSADESGLNDISAVRTLNRARYTQRIDHFDRWLVLLLNFGMERLELNVWPIPCKSLHLRNWRHRLAYLR